MAGACGTAVTVRDTVRHMALECPRAALLLDALGRAYARAVGWHVEPGRKCEHLLQEIGAAMVTGYQGNKERGTPPFRALVAEAAHALTAQWRRDNWADTLHFGVTRLYRDVLSGLLGVAKCSREQAVRREAWQVRWYGPRTGGEGSTPGPVEQWELDWIKSGVATEDHTGLVTLRLPMSITDVPDAEVHSSTDRIISCWPWVAQGDDGSPRVRLHIGLGMPIRSARPHAGFSDLLSPREPH